MRLYNTLTKTKEEFQEIHKNKINMYVCGPTTYNYIHIGNARPIIVFDTIRKYFELKNYEVNYIQNFTDVDDKIINRGKEEGMPPLDLANKYINEYFIDAHALNVKDATAHPRVSEHIDEIIALIEKLMEKGIAYNIDGNVFYSVRKFKDYGKLSGKNIDDLLSGARVNVDDVKEDPLDFALWKRAKEGEIFWESPFGKGRPGWHIECSAMSQEYIEGETLDIHGGGQDLIFPHHENEIAQSEGATGEDFVKYWVHNGFITVSKEKMSKSLGNFFLVREVLEKFKGEVIRYFILSTHYRSPIDFNDGSLESCRKGLLKLSNTFNLIKETLDNGEFGNSDEVKEEVEKTYGLIEKAMDDDFNTALGLSHFFKLCKIITKGISQKSISLGSLEISKKIFEDYLVNVFSVLPYEDMASNIGVEIKEAKEGDDEMDNRLIEILLKIRNEARENKDYKYGDIIRDELKNLDIEIIDSKDGTTWKKN